MTCISEQVLVHIGEGTKAAVESMLIIGDEESGAAGDEQRVISGQ